jgi:transcriptional regulator with XRE-family HTH domain
MARWNLTNYKLAQVSGVSQATIGKILRDEHKTASWDVVEQLADGLGKIDPLAKPSFLGALGLSDSYYSGLNSPTAIPVEPHAEIINEVIKILDKNGLLNQEAVEKLNVFSLYDDNPLETSLVDWVLFRMARHRRQQNRQAES